MNKQRKLILTIPLTLLVAGVLFFLYRLTLPPTLAIDSMCRNEIRLNHVGGTWLNGGPIPEEWQFRGSIEGTFERVSESEGIFLAEGFEVEVHEGNTRLAVCDSWPDSPAQG